MRAINSSYRVSSGAVRSTVRARAHRSFEPTERSVAAARCFIRDTLRAWDASDVLDEAVLLVSELVTNAVVHAGTRADVTAQLLDGAIRVDVEDHHPARLLPPIPIAPREDQESGRGLYLSAAISSAWGVEYNRVAKIVWFRLDLPGSRGFTGTTALASPIPAAAALPPVAGSIRVAVVKMTTTGEIASWDPDAVELFGWTADEARRLSFKNLVAWPEGRGASLSLPEVLELGRWQGSYGVRHRDGLVVQTFASHVRVETGEGPSVVCLLVHEPQRALLELPPAPPVTVSRRSTSDDGEWVGLSDAVTARVGLNELLRRTVERARDALMADAAYVLLATDIEGEAELRAATGLPPSVRPNLVVPAGGGNGRIPRLPAVRDDLRDEAVPLLEGTNLRSLVTVPLLVEGRVSGTLGVASSAPRAFSNDDAVRLQRAADRIALAVESARLTELERQRRGWLSFLAEASDLLAGTLNRDMTMAIIAQLIVPRLAMWCAVHLVDTPGTAPLAYVWHADERALDGLRKALSDIPPSSSAGSLDIGGDATVVLPLVARGRRLGILVLGNPRRDGFRREALDVAEDLSRRAALALDNARLYGDLQASGQALQRSLLPPDLPRTPGVDFGVAYVAAGDANEVGGDFYDVFQAGADRWCFAIGDVCGKGAEAAAVTGLARHTLRALGREGYPLEDILVRLNQAIIAEGTRSRFLTLLFGELAPIPAGGVQLALVCAGHPLPFVIDDSAASADRAVRQVGTPQPLLGVLDDLALKAELLELRPGDTLVAVTDGVPERRDGKRMLGEEGLAEVLMTCRGMPAGMISSRVQRAVEDFAAQPPRDDMAVLVLRATLA
jgi:serine phosphatase RsbU (regulator of sigma subunit)/anti-sigma regulatory factor (Ser/Thr protein kinase)